MRPICSFLVEDWPVSRDRPIAAPEEVSAVQAIGDAGDERHACPTLAGDNRIATVRPRVVVPAVASGRFDDPS